MWKNILWFLMSLFLLISCENSQKSGELTSCSSNSDCQKGYNCFFEKCYSSDAFISTWFLTTSDNTVQLPLVESGTYDFTVDWGDGEKEKITNSNYLDKLPHVYEENGGKYIVSIKGTIEGWQFCKINGGPFFCDESDANKIIEVAQWGSLSFGDTEAQFGYCQNLELTAFDSPNLSKTTSLRAAFFGCQAMLPLGTMFSDWDVSNITNMSLMFADANNFNQDISGWDVSKVTNMSGMFLGTGFNQDISSWDVSNVKDMSDMFAYSAFNSNLSSWDVSNVENMSMMFAQTDGSNGISEWDVSNVKDMGGMFWCASGIDDISGWDVSSVTDMGGMFAGAKFHSDISGWDVSNVKDMDGMFVIDEENPGLGSEIENYDGVLINWSKLSLQKDVVFDAASTRYSETAEDARNKIINDFNWTIIDGGKL
ncbi:MAG TPA: BspA family leucine-rich repeat surface protein [bacterium]|nr:BspA family leucine-rich repeat surface protein [bacterium]